jgi:hypothetical protein
MLVFIIGMLTLLGIFIFMEIRHLIKKERN